MKLAVTILVFCVAGLLALGMVMLYSSSMMTVGSHYLTMQLTWCGFGLVLCVGMILLDYRWLKMAAWPCLAVALVLLLLVFERHIGIRVNGARRWIHYGSVGFQPSEFAKLALLLVLAWYGERYQRQMQTWKRGILIPALVIALVLGLVFIEPDRGCTVLLACVSGAMLLVAGVQLKFIVPPVFLSLVGLGVSLLHDPVRIRRIFAWLYLEDHKSGAGYQAYQAMLALGAGGWTGLGLGNGRQKLGFVPEHHIDFILSVIGEELGVVATLLVVVAFVAIILGGLYIAWRAPDTFGLLLGTGITLLIGLQAFINIGVVTSALPNKGLPLPFISYGGSNLLMMLTSVGVLLAIARQARSSGALLNSPAEAEGGMGLRRQRNPFKAPEPEHANESRASVSIHSCRWPNRRIRTPLVPAPI
jgi:cell division protein FtsW